jgi:hypothetical protein
LNYVNRSGLKFIPSLLDEGVLSDVVEVAVELVIEGIPKLIFATSVPNGSANVVASDLLQQSNDLSASQHQEVKSLGSQKRIASLPAAVQSTTTLVLSRIIEYRLNLLTVCADVRAVRLTPARVRARVALIVVFCGQVAEAVGKALPVERTAVAALGEAGNVVWRGVAIRIVASLGLSLKAACEEGDEDGRQLERDCEGG